MQGNRFFNHDSKRGAKKMKNPLAICHETGKLRPPMETTETSIARESVLPPKTSNLAAQPKSIADLVVQADFPQSTVGEFVNIGGYVGLVTEIVRQSLKVRSAEGSSRTFNSHTLRKLYGPVSSPEASPMNGITAWIPPQPKPAEPEVVEEKSAPPPREIITEPNFAAPLKPISAFVCQPDFPKCAYGEHVDLDGYKGVVVEIVRQRSLKVKSTEGITRSYNIDQLRKLYRQPK